MDLRLITILPPQSTQGVQQTTNAKGNPSGGLTNLSGIPSGTLISGFIVNRDGSGNPVLRTESGDITFASNFFLKIGSEVQIRVEQTVGNTLARILTVDGQPPEQAQARSAFATTPDVIFSQALSSRGPVSNLLGSDAASANTASSIATSNTGSSTSITVNGTIISAPNQTSGQTVNINNLLPAGTALTLKLVSIAPQTGNADAAINNTNKNIPSSYAAYARASGSAGSSTTGLSAPTIPTSTVAQPATSSVNTSSSGVTTPATTTVNPNSINAPPQSPVTSNPLSVPPNATAADATITSTPTSNNSLQLQSGSSPTATSGQNLTTSPNLTVGNNTPAASAGSGPQVSVTQASIAQIGQVVSGTVIGNDPNGEALVQTSLGIVRLQPGTRLPTGSTISFELLKVSQPQTQINAANAASESASLGEIARQWNSLSQILSLLTNRDREAGIDFVQPNMPWIKLDGSPSPQSLTNPQNMSSGLLFFLAAVKGESFKDWLGKHNTQWLENNGHGALLKKAAGEFLAMARQYNEPPANQQWQTLIFPVAVEGEIQQVKWFLKRDRKQNNKQSADAEDTRFVVELDLTQLGEIQMDGFIRKPSEQNIHFDLMIRSKTPLSQDVQKEILAIYTMTGELTGYQGSLQFQSVKEFPVDPTEEINSKPHNNVVV